MEITREVPMVTAEESDQCTVTLAIGTTAFDLTPQEAIHAGFELIRLGHDAEEHDWEQQANELSRVSAHRPDFDVDTTWWCRRDGCDLVFASKAEAQAHKAATHDQETRHRVEQRWTSEGAEQ